MKQICGDIIDKSILKNDKKNGKKIENVVIGKKCIYPGNYFFSGCYAVPFSEIKRLYKRIAMSKGGFTGKGLFGSMPYLVIETNENVEKVYRLKHEENVDKIVKHIELNFQNIKTISENVENQLRQIREERQKRKKKNLSEEAISSIEKLKKRLEFLNKNPDIFFEYSAAAKRKRAFTLTKGAYGFFALAISIVGLLALAFGIVVFVKGGQYGLYCALFGLAAIFLFSSYSVLPTRANNKKQIFERYDVAKKSVETFLAPLTDLEIPKKYVHPATISRMILAIEEGRAENIEEAFEEVKRELKNMNNTTSLYQDEYNEVMSIKPIFLIEDYQ